MSILHLSPEILLLVIVLGIVLITVLTLVVLWRSKRKQEEAQAQEMDDAQADESSGQPPPALEEKLPELETRHSVSSALSFLKKNSIGRGKRYRSPWYLVLGAESSGKSSLLENSGISMSLREGAADFGVSHGLKWRFFDAGVLLDIPGEFFLNSEQTASDERKWKSLLRNLVRYRPQRPIDGVVLTIPATELFGETATPLALVGQRGAHIFDKLWQIQKWTGLCFPVYVVITKCDVIPGFKAMARQLPTQYRNEMFGWSNPYNLEAAFDPSWVDQGFDELSYSLNRLEAEILTERSDIADLDSLFLFSSQLRLAQRPLKIYLNQIFKKSAYRESLQFRGFYFTGDISDDLETAQPVRALAASAAAGAGAGMSYTLLPPDTSTGLITADQSETEEFAQVSSFAVEHRHHKPVFVADLFESKIFPERGIAHPEAKTFLSRNRTVVALQIACITAVIVLSLGMWLKYRQLSATQRVVVPTLDHLLTGVRASANAAPDPGSHQEEDTAFGLIHAMETLTGRNFRSVFFPTSLGSSLDDHLKSAMVGAFEQLVYATFRQELISKKEHLLKEVIKGSISDDDMKSAPLPITDVQKIPSFSRLQELTSRLLALEENIENYNELATHGKGTVTTLAALESYLHNHQLPTNFDYEGNVYFHEALRQASGERIEYTPEDCSLASAKMHREIERFFVEWMANNTVITYLDQIKTKIDALDRQELEGYGQLAELKNTLEQAQSTLTSPDLLWLANEKLALFGPINDVTKSAIERSHYLTPKAPLEDFVDSMEHKNYVIMQEKLRDERTSLTGPLLTLDNSLVRVSPETVSLAAMLGKFLDLPFVKREGTQGIITKLRPDERLYWNKDPLQEAVSLQDAFTRFEQQELNDLSPGLRSTFSELSASYLEANMADLIARAQTFTSVSSSSDAEERMNAEVQNFQDASELLSTLLADLDTLGLTQAHNELLQVTTAQAGNLLMKIDRKFEAQSPYSVSVNNFERWTGENTPSNGGFDTHGPEEMVQYLSFQRQQVQQYATKAAPLVKFLEGRIPAGGKEPGRTLVKWQHIVAEVQKYTAKIPGTSLATLEDFIGTDVDKASPENCQATFLTVAARPSDDYFVQTRESLRRSLVNRCHVLSEQNAVRAYGNMARFFNQHLAGKFPFSAPPQEQMPSEADPQDVVELFRLLDTSGKSIHAGLQSGVFGNSYSRVTTFMSQLEALRPLFSPMTAADVDPVPVFDFVPAFRVNQGREINGNQIIDWTLQVGSDAFHYRDPQRTGRWNYGQPVKLTLRWAKDSPQQPLSSPGAVDGKPGSSTVTFEYRDAWALFTMLALHQPVPNDFDRMTDPDPQTLVFSVNDSKSADPAQAGTNVPVQAKVFVRLKLRPPGKPDNLRVRAFPTAAPSLETKTETANVAPGGDQQ